MLVEQMLGATKRAGVPIRRSFLQTPPGVLNADGTRAALLSKFARDTTALDCYLWISAMASASEPYDSYYPASSWAQVAGLTEHAELDAARARWAKATSKLVSLKLIKRVRKGADNKMRYALLREDGSGDEYTRPTKATDGHWFVIPHLYWIDGWDRKLAPAEKLVLLVALDQQAGFNISPQRMPNYYGLSESTAKRGYTGLVGHGILTREDRYAVSAKSPTGWRHDVLYTAAGDWSVEARSKAMRKRPAPKFTPTDSGEEEES